MSENIAIRAFQIDFKFISAPITEISDDAFGSEGNYQLMDHLDFSRNTAIETFNQSTFSPLFKFNMENDNADFKLLCFPCTSLKCCSLGKSFSY